MVETLLSDIMIGSMALLLRRGMCLGRAYSVGIWQRAAGESTIAVLDKQGRIMHEEPLDGAFEAVRRFAELESAVPDEYNADVIPQYETY